MADSEVRICLYPRDTDDYSDRFVSQLEKPKLAISNDLLSRLTSKAGIQSTLILSKSDGSILQCTGRLASRSQISDIDTPASPARLQGTTGQIERPAESLAKTVFAFVDQAKEFADGVVGDKPLGEKGGEGEEVRLLRLRTRKEEIVVYPGKCLHCGVWTR